jgi:AraC family transcriptional regulator
MHDVPPPPDRLRALLDLVVGSLDEAGADGRALAQRASFSRDHLDRLLASATGESPVALRRRLLLERAAWQLAHGGATPTEAAHAAGYGSLAAFTRAFGRAHGIAPSAVRSNHTISLPAPNGLHFHPPAAVSLPGDGSPAPPDALARLRAHLAAARTLLVRAEALTPSQLTRAVRPGFVVISYEGEEPDAATMCEHLVRTPEVWTAAIAGEPYDGPRSGGWVQRLDRSGARFLSLVAAIDTRGAWAEGFVDALCDPPESFTYAQVVADELELGRVRRTVLAGVLDELEA